MSTEGYRYVLGSVLNQVLLHQSIIGLESKIAMEKLEEYPDVVIGCAGGGSNLGGLIAPFMQDKLLGKADPRIIAVEDVYKRQPEDNTGKNTLLFFHGGGWVTESIDTYNKVCDALARAARSRVISVEYRLAPEHPFPQGLDDCYAAAR